MNTARLAQLFRRTLTRISPKLNSRITYRVKFGEKLDLNNPVTLNEKILWLKFNKYQDDPLVKKCADKYRVREYIESIGRGDILNELLGVYKRPEEIDWESLPNSFVIKLNTGCGFNYIVPDKNNCDIRTITATINQWLEVAPEYYLEYAEMQYKDVKPVILIERYLGGENGELPDDYKFYCINGKCYLVMLCKNRDSHGHGASYIYVDRDGNVIANKEGKRDFPFTSPSCFSEAIDVAEELSKEFPFVRVDLFLLGDRIFFGELTFTPAAGMDIDHKMIPFDHDEDLDHIYGKLLKLPM